MSDLRRTLGVGDAVVIGAGSMIGAGVFVAWAPAARAAGNGLLVGLVIAAVVAWCNATSSAQLAALHPESGGTYVYGRVRLGPGWGHLAGWGFVVGKTASCAAMSLTIGAYLWPAQDRLVAAVAVIGITAVNLGGLTRTVAVTKVLLVAASLALVTVIVGGWSAPAADPGNVFPIDGDPIGIVRSAGFLFFAFAGYARIATLGEEVRDPATTIPRAIPRALGTVLVVYAVVAITALSVVPAEILATSTAPLRVVVEAGPLHWLSPAVRIGAAVASLGVLLNLVPGVSRTALAMARNRELPRWFAGVDEHRALPLRAELTVAAVVLALVVVLDVRNAIGVSGVAVLSYYAVTNAAAWTLAGDERRSPRWIAGVGFAGCLILIAALPGRAIVTGAAALVLGVVARAATERRSPTAPTSPASSRD